MRKFLAKVSMFLIYTALWYTVFPYAVDSFNVFHADDIRLNGNEPNQHYIKVEHVIHNPEKFNSFIFGSSRVGAIHTERMTEERCYNMTYSAGTPAGHLENLKTFIEHNIIPQRVYMGVDSLSYTWDYQLQKGEPMRCPWKQLHDHKLYFCKLYLDPAMTMQSLRSVLTAIKGNYNDYIHGKQIFYEYGWGIPYNASRSARKDGSDPAPSYGISSVDIQSTLDEIKEFVKICDEHKIDLIIFTNPMHWLTYEGSVREKQYLEFLEGLAEISDFWNFSSLNDITLSEDYYLETSHYKAEVGDKILNVICSGEVYPELYAQGFGVKVTRDNVKDLITLLEHQAEDFRRTL